MIDKKMDAETLYRQFGVLAETMPDLQSTGPYPIQTIQWLARVHALLGELGELLDQVEFKIAWDSASKYADDQDDRRERAGKMTNVLFRALAIAELHAPPHSQGAFIPAGSALEAFAGVARVLAGAKKTALIVDPYMDQKALTDFAVTAPDNVSIHLLADKADYKPSLTPAVERWGQQHPTRPLEARLTPHKTLHDRLIIIDGKARTP